MQSDKDPHDHYIIIAVEKQERLLWALNLRLELLALKGLAKIPVIGGYTVGCACDPITGGDLKGEGLVLELCIDMPDLAPVSSHLEPPSC